MVRCPICGKKVRDVDFESHDRNEEREIFEFVHCGKEIEITIKKEYQGNMYT